MCNLTFMIYNSPLDFDPRLESAGLFLNFFLNILNVFLYNILYRFDHIYSEPQTKLYQTENPETTNKLNFISNGEPQG